MNDFWKPTDTHFIAEPQPYYEKLRLKGSIIKVKTGDYVLLGYDVCKAVLNDDTCKTGFQATKIKKIAEYAKKKGTDLNAIEGLMNGMLIQMNDPIHPFVRSNLAKAWPNSATIKTLSKRFVEEHLSTLPNAFDAINDLCKMIPLSIISHLLGFPPEKAINYVADGLKVVQSLNPYFSLKDLVEIQKSSQRLSLFIEESIHSEDYNPTPLAEAIITISKEHDELSEIPLLAFLFIAGFETTTTLLATCLYHLLKNPVYITEVQKKGASLFVKEILRIHSPVQITGRRSTSKLMLNNMEIPEDAVLTLCLGAANTDPKHFKNPLTIDWERPKYDHLSFGYGLHHCLGSQLAEIEATVFIEALLPLLSQMDLLSEPVFENKFAVKSFKSMHITFR